MYRTGQFLGGDDSSLGTSGKPQSNIITQVRQWPKKQLSLQTKAKIEGKAVFHYRVLAGSLPSSSHFKNVKKPEVEIPDYLYLKINYCVKAET